MNKFQDALLNNLNLELSVNQFHAEMESDFNKLGYLMRVELLEKTIDYYKSAMRIYTDYEKDEKGR